ncbi:MAG: DUF2892 domain-containing protein [Aliarcobacter sp.]|nr:DUF2892 domain-containing protein [Aliarcobacter sp.]
MNKNIGSLDKTIRLIVGVLIIVAGFLNDSLWGAIGLIPIITALGFMVSVIPYFKNQHYLY